MSISAALDAVLGPSSAERLAIVIAGSSTTRRYAEDDFAVSSVGHFHGRVLGVDPLASSVESLTYSLERPTARVRLADYDKDLALAIACGSTTHAAAQGAAVTIYVAERTVAQASWYPLRVGVVEEPSMDGPYEWSFTIAPNDLALRRNYPDDSWVIGTWDWPLAHASARGQMAPDIYGTHDSSIGGGGGAVPLYRVDEAGLRYLVCQGAATGVDRVYVAGELKDTGWSSSTTTVNNRLYTVVTFTADPGDDKEVRADVRGMSSTGGGGGSLLDDPVDAIGNLLNRIYGGWSSGAWPTSAPTDATSLANVKAWLATTSLSAPKCARWIGAQTTGIQLLNEWCETFGVWVWWSDAGQISVAYDDHRSTAAAYVSTPLLPGGVLVSAPSVAYPVNELTARAVATLESASSAAFNAYDSTAKAGGSLGSASVACAWTRNGL